ncbi:hypothetical protein ACFT1B_34790, partial [Streptomyces griseoincarnatus]
LLDPTTPITDLERQDRTARVATDAPLIVLTEGSTDASLLSLALSVTHPHLVGFVRFMDFSNRPEGGAASLAKLVTSFEAAGVANRVLALADNDTAAHDALKKLKTGRLPNSYRVRHYPDLPLLSDYPTLGPQSNDPVFMDVNRKAGILEMYLGRELLEEHGRLAPVQWTGYVKSLKAYQGAIDDQIKRRIQTAFRKKVTLALNNPRAATNQDWTGVRAIIETILTAFDTP